MKKYPLTMFCSLLLLHSVSLYSNPSFIENVIIQCEEKQELIVCGVTELTAYTKSAASKAKTDIVQAFKKCNLSSLSTTKRLLLAFMAVTLARYILHPTT